MRRVPIFATIVVLAAAAVMVALGVWQLQRLDQKEALLPPAVHDAIVDYAALLVADDAVAAAAGPP